MIPHADLRLELEEPDDCEAVWCEFCPGRYGSAKLRIGFETGSCDDRLFEFTRQYWEQPWFRTLLDDFPRLQERRVAARQFPR